MSFIRYVVDQDGQLRAINTELKKIYPPLNAVEYHTQLDKDLHLITFSS